MAFLAHLQTFTWIAWILDREADDKGIRLDSTHQPWPPMRPRIIEPRGLVCVAWVGRRNKSIAAAGAAAALAEQRHDVVVTFVCGLLLQTTCRLCKSGWRVGPKGTSRRS